MQRDTLLMEAVEEYDYLGQFQHNLTDDSNPFDMPEARMDELEGCELGTQEFWNSRYKQEVRNYRSHGDVGEVWFGEDIVDRIIRWMNNRFPEEKSTSVLDVGCGNGMLLIELHKEGYTNLKGIDYSSDAITLAKEIAAKEDRNIHYEVSDILNSSSEITDVDVVLDKGTYDAISLSADPKNKRNTYIVNVKKFMKDDGVLVITSCNWTQDELCSQFEHEFVFAECIPTPQFKFGGKVGNVVSSVIFKKKTLN